ncbi:MAG: GNAT family N-acetyltransferase [Actinomycetota bacterium]|nr:GNAT family N-acetyltransferase [Actinomycetota bacterium]
MPGGEVIIRDAPVSGIDPATLYRILALRTDIFVVEQSCAYPELDGRDLEPSARLVWAECDGAVLATLRLLIDPDETARIGRVATNSAARGRGLAGELMRRALDLAAGRPVVLHAQSYLVAWYEQFGFVRSGPDFDDDGIAHAPMRLG